MKLKPMRFEGNHLLIVMIIII